MPPKGRPRRTSARKSIPAQPKSSISAESSAEAIVESEKPPTEAPHFDVVLGLDPSSKTLVTGDSVSAKQSALLEPQVQQPQTVSVPQDDAVLPSSSETLAPPEVPVNEEAMVNSGGADLAKGTALDIGKKDVVTDDNNNISDNNVNNNNENAAKTKKVVKKTVKVVKKVLKKVPKKVVKPLIGSKIDELDETDVHAIDSISDSKSAISAEVNTVQSEPASVNVQFQVDNQESDVLACIKEVEENKFVNAEKKEYSEVKGGVEIKGTELMEVDDNVCGVVETEGECGKEGDKLGINDGEKEKGEEVVGGQEEGKLFSGELEAMERKKRRKTEVFIGGLDKDTKEEDIRKVFAEVGEIVDLRVLTSNKTGKKFAFLRYASAEAAKMALEKFAKVKICGKECGATPVEGNDTIFLGNIDKKWKDEDVVKLLNTIGIDKIDKVVVMLDPNNKQSNRGFGFVEFETIRDAQAAYSKLQEKGVFGKNKNLKVAWAEPLKELDEEEMLKVKTVYAEFIPSSWDEDKVRDAFKKFGDIDDIVLARNLRTSKRKDFAFVRYKNRVAAIKCLESIGHEYRDEDGTKVHVKVSLAKPVSKGKNKPAANVTKEVLKANPKISHYKVRPSDPRNRIQPGVPRFDIQIPQMSSTNLELIQLLREQASWRPSHANLSNSPINMHYNNLTGRKRQFSVLETDPLSGDVNRYPHSRLDASFSVASSSHSVVPESGPTNPLAYQRHSGYPSGSLYGARNYASNVEIRDQGHASNYLYRRY